jgi:hypothetical protein
LFDLQKLIRADEEKSRLFGGICVEIYRELIALRQIQYFDVGFIEITVNGLDTSTVYKHQSQFFQAAFKYALLYHKVWGNLKGKIFSEKIRTVKSLGPGWRGICHGMNRFVFKLEIFRTRQSCGVFTHGNKKCGVVSDNSACGWCFLIGVQTSQVRH